MNCVDIALWLLTDACAAAALTRLFLLRLQSRYRAFEWMLIVILLRDLVLVFCRRNVFIPWSGMHLYTLAWIITLVPALLTQAAAGFECYRRMAGLYPKIGRFAAWLYGACLTVSVLICLTGLRTETRHISGAEATFRVAILAIRWQTALECGALVLAAFFLALFPPPMRRRPRNVLLHVSLLAAYFAAYAITTWLKNALPMGDAIWIERGLFLLVSGFYATWAVRLHSSGEEVERWPGLDDEVVKYIKRREQVALELLRSLARSAGQE
jgi:hypothetical protein